MKHLLLASTLTAALAAPVIAESPAETFGQSIATDSSSAATLSKAAEVLQGDMVDERLPFGDNEIVTRSSTGPSQGVRQLAVNMGVDAGDYTGAELSRMFISKYD